MHSTAISKASGLEVSKSIEDIVSRKENTLIVYAAKNNYKELQANIINNVLDVMRWFDKSHEQLNEEQLKIQIAKKMKVANDVAELIIEDYNDLPIDCINLFFKDVKKGKFGNSYGSISGSDIMRWFGEFYQEYWKEFYDHREQEKKKEIESTDECFVGIPESVQRLFNKFAGKGYRTDAECEQSKTIEQIRKDVISQNMHLYSTMSVDEADRTIDNKIKIALMAEGIFE